MPFIPPLACVKVVILSVEWRRRMLRILEGGGDELSSNLKKGNDSILALQTLLRELEVRRGHHVQVLSRRPPTICLTTIDNIVKLRISSLSSSVSDLNI